MKSQLRTLGAIVSGRGRRTSSNVAHAGTRASTPFSAQFSASELTAHQSQVHRAVNR